MLGDTSISFFLSFGVCVWEGGGVGGEMGVVEVGDYRHFCSREREQLYVTIYIYRLGITLKRNNSLLSEHFFSF